MPKFLSNINLESANDVQFKTAAGVAAGKIEQDGNDLVLSNAVGDVLLGDGTSDVYIGDGANSVDILFEQSGAIKGDGSAVTLTLGGSGTTLNLEDPNINGTFNVGATNISDKLTFTTANGYILFDHEPSGDTGEYTTEVPLLKVGMGTEETAILSRTSEYRGVVLGADDTVWLRAGDTGAVIKTNVGLTTEVVLMSAEQGFHAYAFPNNTTTWSNRNEFRFYGGSSTAADNGLYIGEGGNTQFIDLSRNLTVGTISSGAITSTDHIKAKGGGNIYVYDDDDDNKIHIHATSNATEGVLKVTNGSNYGLIARGLANSPRLGTYHTGSLNIYGFGDSSGVNHVDDDLLAQFDFANEKFLVNGEIEATSLDADNITSTANSGDASIYINSTRPTLGFTDSNSFADANDIYLIRGGTDILQFQWHDDSAATTTETFNITSVGDATFAGTIDSGAITSTGAVQASSYKIGTTTVLQGTADITIGSAGGTGTISLTTHTSTPFKIEDDDSITISSNVTAGSNSLTAGSLDINGSADISGDLTVSSKIIHAGDTNTWVGFDDGNDTFRAVVGGSEKFHVNSSRTRISNNNLEVNGDLDLNGAADISGTLSGVFVARSTNNANADGPNFNVSTTNKSTAEYAYRVDRTGVVKGGILIGGGLVGIDLDINGNADISGNLTGVDTLTAQYGRFTSTGDASVGGTTHAFQAGTTASTNIIIDNNEIMARSNGAVAVLNLNPDGGNVTFHNNGNGSTIDASGNATFAGEVQATSLDINGSANISGLLTWSGTDYGDAINLSEGDITTVNEINAYEFKQRATGEPRSNLGSPTVTEMGLFDSQFTPKTTLANGYDNLDDLKFFTRASGSTEGDYAEVTTYSDDEKRKFLRTNTSTVKIDNTHNSFRVEFVAHNYTYANAMYAYWSSQSHNTQVQVYKYNVANSAWVQHTSSTTTVSAWPGHLYLPFSQIPWHETQTTSTTHYEKIRIEFTPTWVAYSGTGIDYSDRDILLYGMQIWGGYPGHHKRTVHSYDQNGKLDLFKDLGLPDNGVATFGSGDDLQIYHDGSNSYIKDVGTGSLSLDSDGTQINLGGGGENFAIFRKDAEVELYFNGVEKLATKTDGVNVVGELQADSLDIDGNADISGNLTVDGGLITIDQDAAGAAFTWKESDGTIVAGQMRGYANRGDIYLYADGVKTTELSAISDSFIPALHIGGSGAASGGVLQTTGSVNIDGNADISGTLTVATISAIDYGLDSADIPNNGANTTGSSGSCTGNAATATLATTVTVTDNENTAENNLIAFVADEGTTTGAHGLEMDGNLHYNPSTGLLTSTSVNASLFTGDLTGDVTGNVEGDLTGTADVALTADLATHVVITDNESTNENNQITFIEGAAGSGQRGLESDGDFHYNPSTGTVTATIFNGEAATVATNANLTGHITSTGNATVLGAFSSADLLGALTDETGTGSAVFASNAVLTAPVLGTPYSGNLANCYGINYYAHVRTAGTTAGDTGAGAEIIQFGTGSVVAGKIYQYSGGVWTLANATAESSSSKLLGVARSTNTSAAAAGMCIRGMVTLAVDTTGADGDVLWLKTADGDADNIIPTGNTHIARVIGYCQDNGKRIFFNPDSTFVEITA
jgi:hypothetical protein